MDRIGDSDRFFSLSGDLFCVVDVDGHFKRVNPSFTELLGYAQSELIGHSVLEFIHPDDREVSSVAIAELAKGLGFGDFENRYLDKSGRSHLIYWRAVFDHKEGVAYGVGRDVTERRALEERVLQSQKLDAVGLLAGGIAHDFNNLILGVMMNAELAARTVSEGRARVQLDEILRAGRRARELTRQLLAFSASHVFEPVVADLAEIVSAVYPMIRRLIPESIEMIVDVAEGRLPARVDRSQLEQVVVNLCLNARDAMPKGGVVTIEVATSRGKSGELGPTVAVRDTGAGMSEEVKQRAFEPFFTTKGPGVGSGLGLTTVQTVVERHGGNCYLDSGEGRGTYVRVWLPASEGGARAHDSGSFDDCQLNGGNETVLLAEDDDSVRNAMLEVLRSAGYKVVVAKDGDEAIEAFERESGIAVALLDLVMPRRSGHDVFLAIRQRCQHLPVIFATGYSDGVLPAEALEEPRVSLLRKPFRPSELLHEIRRALDRVA